jgi:hypothetical protein
MYGVCVLGLGKVEVWNLEEWKSRMRRSLCAVWRESEFGGKEDGGREPRDEFHRIVGM